MPDVVRLRLRAPEFRPVRDSYRIDTESKTEIRSFIHQCTTPDTVHRESDVSIIFDGQPFRLELVATIKTPTCQNQRAGRARQARRTPVFSYQHWRPRNQN